MLNVPYRQLRQHLSAVPLLPVKASSSPWGPFAKRGARGASAARGAPHPAVAACACGALVLLFVAVVSFEGLSFKEDSSSSSSPLRAFSTSSFHDDVGVSSVTDLSSGGGRRRLQQWLAPIKYSLPTLFDSLYNLVRIPVWEGGNRRGEAQGGGDKGGVWDPS